MVDVALVLLVITSICALVAFLFLLKPLWKGSEADESREQEYVFIFPKEREEPKAALR